MTTITIKSSFLLSLLLSAGLYAQNIELDAVDVTAEAQEDFLDDTTKKDTSTLAKEAKGETLGDYLEDEQFVDSTSYGPAVGRPVVRGMDGYRVGVTNGNVILNDLSAMSQDHAVGIMARASENIELIKGPSSLLYGNYSGGVIRVTGEEHNKELLRQGYSLDTVSSYGTNGAGTTLGTTLKASDHNLSLSVNGFYHDAERYKDGNNHTVKDSNTLSEQSHIVLGYQADENNVIKIYGDILHKDYGIPNNTAESTSIVMDQEQLGVIWHAQELFPGLEHMQTEVDYSDYLHSEYEGNSADGLFGQKQFTVANTIEVLIGEWELKTNAEYQTSELKVCHDHGHCTHFYNAPRTGVEDGVDLQEKIDQYGHPYAHGHPMPNTFDQRIKFGGSASQFLDDDNELKLALRSEFRQLDPNSENIQEQWLVTDEMDPHYYDTINDFALSGSAGFNGYITSDLAFNTSLSYIERLPSATELFWNGFHHATNSYIFGDRYLDNEQSVNFDLDLLYTSEPFTSKASLFYYHFFNYIYQNPLFNDNNIQELDPFHQSEVWQIKGVPARVYGIALEENYTKTIDAHKFDLTFKFEAIRARLNSGGNLPRIPTFNGGVSIEHSYKGYKGKISYKYMDKNRFKADNETDTPAYNWVSAFISYHQKTRYLEYELYLKGENLTNEIAYNNLSFLKETAPLAGRQISIGLEMKF
ncbi:MAG: TonB-dependent receptor [Sulfurovum sp.]|jgi:iron complex outermembrane receptor protein